MWTKKCSCTLLKTCNLLINIYKIWNAYTSTLACTFLEITKYSLHRWINAMCYASPILIVLTNCTVWIEWVRVDNNFTLCVLNSVFTCTPNTIFTVWLYSYWKKTQTKRISELNSATTPPPPEEKNLLKIPTVLSILVITIWQSLNCSKYV